MQERAQKTEEDDNRLQKEGRKEVAISDGHEEHEATLIEIQTVFSNM